MSRYTITNKTLTWREFKKVLSSPHTLALNEQVKKQVKQCRAFVESKIKDTHEAYYGINTGFGSLCNVSITNAELSDLQTNLIRSHACGTGQLVPDHIVKLMLLLKIKSLSFGYSGVRLKIIEHLMAFYNHDLLPIVPSQGSLGASGDLAPLAHLSLPLLGEGKVRYKGRIMSAATALKKINIPAIKLGAKEGLALLNGTQFSLAYAVWSVYQADKILATATMTLALSMDAYLASSDPYNQLIHKIRKQIGQSIIAKNVLKWLSKSELRKVKSGLTQDPYSFRCTPQVLGASFDAINYVREIVTREINSVTDNPNIFVKENKILTGGNFHAQPLALALDFMAIALSEIGSISERRTYLLINGDRGLPSYLTSNPGLNSGFMIAQYTAASIASQNKQFCTPASIDSIISSKGQEDHVSMAANAGTKLYKIVENIWNLLSIEYFTASQAINFRLPKKSSPRLEKILTDYRRIVKPVVSDRILSYDFEKTNIFLQKLTYE